MLNLRHRLLVTILFTTLFTCGAFAQSLTQILDTIHNPDGTTFNGRIVFTLNGPSGAGGGSVSARVYNGALSIFLAPTTTAEPGTYYQVTYTSSNGLVIYNEDWQVPPSATSLMVGEVRVSSTGGGGSTGSGSGPGVQYATLPIAISQVTNLSADLSSINGSIASLTSQVTDLAASVASTGNISALQTTVNNLSTTVTGLSATVSALNSTVAGLSSTVSSNSTALTGLSSTVSGLSSTVSGHTGSLSTLAGNLNALTSIVTGHTSSLNSLNATVSGLNTSVTNLGDSLTALISTVNGLNAGGSNMVFVDAETPAGTLNGSNAAFTLAHSPAPTASLTLFRNGVLQRAGTDFTLSEASIVFASGSVPQAGDSVHAYYRTAGTGMPASFNDAELPAGTINGTNLMFTLANAPSPAASLMLFKNGVLQGAGTDFTVSEASVVFASGSVPQAGDAVRAYYRTAGTGMPASFNDAELPVGTINGTNLTFTLANAPSPAASLMLFKNGVLLTQGVDYALSGATVTFTSTTVAPQAGDSLTASYRH